MTAPSWLVRERIATWQEQLLQIDRRNNLLYFKSSRTSVRVLPGPSVPGVTPRGSIDGFLNELSSSKGGLKFPYAERRAGRAPQGQDGGDDYVLPGDFTVDCPLVELQRRLRALQKKDKEWLEEQGVNVLFLAVGFLHWIDEDGEEASSPLLLVPCDLNRASPRDHFFLVEEQDDTVANSTLRYALKKLFDIDLPEFGDSSAEEYLRQVERLLKGRKGWSVSDELTLATFQYSKLAMWEDLEALRDEDDIEPLVCALGGDDDAGRALGTGSSSFPSAEELPGAGVDDLVDPRDQLLILKADASQVLAIAEARRGNHLVIHGPPGTGKSQTIANLIGALIADGKSVLFVSEKTAALDVVKRRLEGAQLGVFCLDLHSERGRKANVYEQFRASMTDSRAVPKRAFDYPMLLQRRNDLNALVRALHVVRDPLRMTVYGVHGRFSALRAYPDVEVEAGHPGKLTQDRLSEAVNVARKLASWTEEFREHETSRWLPLRPSPARLRLADELRAAISAAIEDLRLGERELSDAAAKLALAGPESLAEAGVLATLAGHFESLDAPIPPAWLVGGSVERLTRTARHAADAQNQRRRLETAIRPWIEGTLPELDFGRLAKELEGTTLQRAAFEAALGVSWERRLVEQPVEILSAAEHLPSAVAELKDAGGTLGALLGQPSPATWGNLAALLDLAASVERMARVPSSWLVRDSDPANAALASGRMAAERLASCERRLLQEFDEQVVEAVDQPMLVRYRTDHRKLFARFSSRFKADQRLLQGWKRTPGKLSVEAATAVVELVLEVKSARDQWESAARALADDLGHRYHGRDTNWDALSQELRSVQATLEAHGWNDRLAQALAGDPLAIRAAHVRATEAKDQVASLERVLRAHPAAEAEALEWVSAAIEAVMDSLRAAVDVLRSLGAVITRMPAQVHEAAELLRSAEELATVQRDDASRAEALARDFGSRFTGNDTDWAAIERALKWVQELQQISRGTRFEAVTGQASAPLAAEEYRAILQGLERSQEKLAGQLALLDIQIDDGRTELGDWSRASFRVIARWAMDLADHADEAPAWLGYLDHVAEFESLLGAGSVTRIRRATGLAADIVPIVERRILSSWLESVYAAEPRLRAFDSGGHSKLIDEFRELDQAAPVAARNEIRQRCFKSYPRPFATSAQSGETAVLNRELSKRRRQLPVRKLLQNIPVLAQALKPCFMMSPLAVSQHLPRGPLATAMLRFDTVVFDEASQVFPEDAIPAIARGKQVIVVGDERQLPPTSFFRKGADDDEFDGDDDSDPTAADALRDRESILDVLNGMKGAGVGERYLQVHYRSRHENLIRFSNHHFYDDRLLVFPSPFLEADGLGLRDVYVEDGRYDSGATRTNRQEAERIVDLVFDMMGSVSPHESIGVVALSRAQANLIESLIEERRVLRRDLEEWFKPDKTEPFFVKNLENVQGDERDHIVLGIGYGPTVSTGKVMNRFGPVNSAGGDRRLNVAISRARRSMALVHSLRAVDVVSEQTGPRLLRRYLEFVESPLKAFEAGQTINAAAETESAFEESVWRALLARGHKVQPQVGVAGYRIDLAIYSEDETQFDLAVECDGYTYHSSPAARDRDWLRQQVLESLGWTFVRVWSTAWARNPDAEIRRIEEALAQARATVVMERIPEPDPALVETDAREEANSPVAIPGSAPGTTYLFPEYREADLKSFRATGPLAQAGNRELQPMLLEICRVEGPVHFHVILDCLRLKYGNGRTGSAMQGQVLYSVRSLEREKKVSVEPTGETDNFFVSLPGQPAVARRPASNSDYRRDVSVISPREIEHGLLVVARELIGTDRDGLIKETARQFGFDRTGPDIRDAAEQAIDRLVAGGELVEYSGHLRCAVQDLSGR